MDTYKFSHREIIFTRIARVAGMLIVVLAIVGFPQMPQQALAQSPRIVASVAGDWLWTTDFTPNAPLALSIYHSQSCSLLWSGSRTAHEVGFVFVGYEDHGLDLV